MSRRDFTLFIVWAFLTLSNTIAVTIIEFKLADIISRVETIQSNSVAFKLDLPNTGEYDSAEDIIKQSSSEEHKILRKSVEQSFRDNDIIDKGLSWK